jgi:hypothetical protein
MQHVIYATPLKKILLTRSSVAPASSPPSGQALELISSATSRSAALPMGGYPSNLSVNEIRWGPFVPRCFVKKKNSIQDNLQKTTICYKPTTD